MIAGYWPLGTCEIRPLEYSRETKRFASMVLKIKNSVVTGFRFEEKPRNGKTGVGRGVLS